MSDPQKLMDEIGKQDMQICELEAENNRLKEQEQGWGEVINERDKTIKRLRDALEKNQWEKSQDGYSYCPSCAADSVSGHSDWCWIKQALRQPTTTKDTP